MKECQWCDKEWLEWGHRVDKEFCSDECRTAWHNERRKIERKLKSMKSQLDDLWFIAKQHEQFGGIIQRGLSRISGEIGSMRNDYFFECRICGQMTYDDVYAVPDEKGAKCAFCGKQDWRRRRYDNARR